MLKVTLKGEFLFTADFVPLLVGRGVTQKKNDIWLVAKPHPDEDKQHMWMRTYCKEESKSALKLPEEYRKVLMIVKVLRLWPCCNEQLTVVPSFIYKTICLRWYSNHPQPHPLSAMILEFLSYMSTCLEKEELRPFPYGHTNLLENFRDYDLKQLSSFLKGTLSDKIKKCNLKLEQCRLELLSSITGDSAECESNCGSSDNLLGDQPDHIIPMPDEQKAVARRIKPGEFCQIVMILAVIVMINYVSFVFVHLLPR
jgi:hypothetical protein